MCVGLRPAGVWNSAGAEFLSVAGLAWRSHMFLLDLELRQVSQIPGMRALPFALEGVRVWAAGAWRYTSCIAPIIAYT